MGLQLSLSIRLQRLRVLPVCACFILMPPVTAAEATPADHDAPEEGTVEGASIPTPTGRTRFWQRITAHEPTYVLVEPAPPDSREVNVKFQLSLAFQLIGNPEVEPESGDTRPNGLYGAFSQTSFWDLGSDSMPFLDSSYRPELFWHQGFKPGFLGSDGLALEIGGGHESNGKDDPDSRSLNHLSIRPIIRWDPDDSWWLEASPRFHWYMPDLSDNPDIAEYRGYADLDVSVGLRDGALINLRGRIGSQWDHGSIQADLSYPLDRISAGWVHGFAYLQAFAGWSENLINYDQRVEQPRILIGIAITR